MLNDLNADQARFMAILARTACVERDTLLGIVAEKNLTELQPARGEHNPTAALGFEPLSPEAPQAAALGGAIAMWSETARRELYALMRIGQGQLAAKKWYRGLFEAEVLGDSTVTSALMEDPDLHDHITKSLYEAKLSVDGTSTLFKVDQQHPRGDDRQLRNRPAGAGPVGIKLALIESHGATAMANEGMHPCKVNLFQ